MKVTPKMQEVVTQVEKIFHDYSADFRLSLCIILLADELSRQELELGRKLDPVVYMRLMPSLLEDRRKTVKDGIINFPLGPLQ